MYYRYTREQAHTLVYVYIYKHNDFFSLFRFINFYTDIFRLVFSDPFNLFPQRKHSILLLFPITSTFELHIILYRYRCINSICCRCIRCIRTHTHMYTYICTLIPILICVIYIFNTYIILYIYTYVYITKSNNNVSRLSIIYT